MAGMDKAMSQQTRTEVLRKLRRRYETAGAEHKRKLLDQAAELLGYHRKSAIRALRAPVVVRGPVILTGRPVSYEPGLLLPWLRPIWRATDYACGRRLVAMLPVVCKGNAQTRQTRSVSRSAMPTDFFRVPGVLAGARS